MGFKKNLMGFKEKVRSQQEIDAEYQFHAANIGHKLGMIQDLEAQLEEHRSGMDKCKAESKALRKTEAKKPPAPAPQAAEPPVSQL